MQIQIPHLHLTLFEMYFEKCQKVHIFCENVLLFNILLKIKYKYIYYN